MRSIASPLLFTVAVLIAGEPAQPKSTPFDPKKDMGNVKTAPGFDYTLFAAPPDVGYPTCIACAPTGEVFVGVDENGSLDRKPDRGRVVRCVDTDGDGKADKFTTFCKVDSPRGLFYDNGRLIVLHPPVIEAWIDEDGDGVAEKHETLVTGLGFGLDARGADHTTNGIRVGIDGWVYIAMGDYGSPNAVGSDKSKLHHRGGGIVRVRQDGSELEMYAQGTRNICDVAIDPLMNVYTLDNTNDGDGWWVRLSHIVQTGNYGYPMFYKNFADELLAPMADYGGGSPVGALYIQEPGISKEWGDALYMCEWGQNKVYRFPLEAAGASFKTLTPKANERISLISVERPTDMDVDGQGRMYVSSWKGATFTYNGPKAGFVIRVTDTSAKLPPFPNLKKATDDELLKHLTSPSHTYRLYSQCELLRRGAKQAIVEGVQKIIDGNGSLPVRVAAIFTLKQLLGEKAKDALVKAAAKDDLREHALRALTDRKKECSGLELKLFTDALSDKNPRVRLQAIVSLGRIGRADVADKIVPLTVDADPFISHIAINTLAALNASYEAFNGLDKDPSVRKGVSRALSYMHDPKVVDGLIERASKVTDPDLRQAVLRSLCRLYNVEAQWDGTIKTWWTTRPDSTGPYYAPVTWERSAAIAKALKEALEKSDVPTKGMLLTEMARNRIDLPELNAMIVKLCAEDAAFKSSAVGAVLNRKSIPADMLKFVSDVATSPKESSELRGRAIRGLGKAIDQPGALDMAVKAAASIDVKNKDLMNAREDFERDNQRNEKHANAIAKMAASAQGAERDVLRGILVNLSKYQKLSKDRKAIVDNALKEIGAPATAVAPKVDPNKLTIKKQKYEEVFAAAQKDPGDAALGEQLFKDAKCVACHTTNPKDPPKGPQLAEVTKLYKRPELIESILKPSAKIAQGFQTNAFIMNDGTRHQGFVIKEAEDSVEIRENQDTQITLEKKEIKTRKILENISIMPDGLVDELSVHELASIIAYLESLNKK